MEVLEKIIMDMQLNKNDLLKIRDILDDALGYFEDKSGNDFYLDGEDTAERYQVFQEIIESQADEDEKDELLSDLVCWTYDTWAVPYLIEILSKQTIINRTQIEMCFVLLKELQTVPDMLQGDYRIPLSMYDLAVEINQGVELDRDQASFFVSIDNLVNYLINKLNFKLKLDF